MINVLLVDDEILAIEYLTNLIDWESHGYHIVGQAMNGKSALELYEKYRPEIVISDIRMIGMDGLELTRCLKNKNASIVVILLSAYRDFEYAKKGIEYGVNNYLLKHELDEISLLNELEKAKQYFVKTSKKEKIYQQYFMNQLIYNETSPDKNNFGNRLFLIMLHRNPFFKEGYFYNLDLNIEEMQEVQETMQATTANIAYYIADARITANNWMVLYRIENEVSKYKVNSLIEEKGRELCNALKISNTTGINLLYSYEIRQEEISTTFQKMSKQIRNSMFWKRDEIYSLEKLVEVDSEEKIDWNEEVEELQKAVYEDNPSFKEQINYLFEKAIDPYYKIVAFKELLYRLENTLGSIEKKEGIEKERQNNNKIFKVEEIHQYYIDGYSYAHELVHKIEKQKYSNLVREIIRYIRKNFRQELSLEVLGEIFQMNGVYLGQIFKKEVGVTFLRYLTDYRIEKAKRLLEMGNYNVSEVAEAVGYKTSQYFSQIFVKTTGNKPQEYRNGRKKENKKELEKKNSN